MMNRIEKFECLRQHPMLGKLIAKFKKDEIDFCETLLKDTSNLKDDDFMTVVNRLGVSHHLEFREFKNRVDMWAILQQTINPRRIYRRRK